MTRETFTGRHVTAGFFVGKTEWNSPKERLGGADLRQAFAGHVALPAPPHWSVILDVDRDAPAYVIHSAYRQLARSAHPDDGGTREAWDRLQAASEAAKKEGRA